MTSIIGSTSSIVTPSSAAPAEPKNESKNFNNTRELYLDSGYTHLPGMANLIFTPMELYYDTKALYQAYKITDREGILAGSLKLLQSPFTFGNAFLLTLVKVLSVGVALDIFSRKLLYTAGSLSSTVLFLGLVLCGIEVVLEAAGLYQAVTLKRESQVIDVKRLNKALEGKDLKLKQLELSDALKAILNHPLPQQIKNEIQILLDKKDVSNADYAQFSETTFKSIKEHIYLLRLTHFYSTHFQISPEENQQIRDHIEKQLSSEPLSKKEERIHLILQANLQKKSNQLTRRLQPWMIKRLVESAPQIIQNLSHSQADVREEATKKAEQLFKNMQIQSTKKILIHTLGLLALTFAIAALIAACITSPFFGSLLILATFFSFAGYYLQRGLMDSEGWKFSVNNCLPSILKKSPEQPLQHTPPHPIKTVSYPLPITQKERMQKHLQETLARMDLRPDRNKIAHRIGPGLHYIRP